MSSRLNSFFNLLKWCALPLALLLVAWAVANTIDDAPKPLPPELELSAPTLPAKDNTFFALYGLHEATYEAAMRSGEAKWADLVEAERIRPSRTLEQAGAEVTSKSTTTQALAQQAFTCKQGVSCYEHWRENKPALLETLNTYKALVDVCNAIALHGKHEELIAPLRTDSLGGVHYSSYGLCIQAVMADAFASHASGDKTATVAKMNAVHQWAMNVLNGSRTLIYEMVALRQLRNIFVMMNELALQDNTYASAFVASLSETLNVAQLSRQFIPYEAAYISQTLSDINHKEACSVKDSALEHALCKFPIGYLKHKTTNDILLQHQAYVKRLQPTDAKLLTAMSKERTDDSALLSLKFRNTFGDMLVNPTSPYYVYTARIADAELHRQVLLATLQAITSNTTADQIATQLKAYAWGDLAQGRVSVDDAAHRITAKPWQAEFNASVPERDLVKVSLPLH